MVMKYVPKGLDADFAGPAPKRDFRPGEAAGFEGIRASLDRVLQVCDIAPSQPQTGHDLKTYTRDLLAEVAKHTVKYSTFASRKGSPDAHLEYAERIIADAMEEPYRKGVLREIKTVDRSGREVFEFVGNKSQWMSRWKGPVQQMTHVDGIPVSEML
jgi:hypothetical protein